MEEDVFVPDEEMTPEAIVVTVHKAWGRSPEGAIIMRLTHNLKEDGGVEQEYFYRADDEFGPLVPELTRMLAANEIALLPWASRPIQLKTFLPRSKKQFRSDLIANSIMPSTVTAKIMAIESEVERETALNSWENSDYYDRFDPLINQIGSLFGLTSDNIDSIWPRA